MNDPAVYIFAVFFGRNYNNRRPVSWARFDFLLFKFLFEKKSKILKQRKLIFFFWYLKKRQKSKVFYQNFHSAGHYFFSFPSRLKPKITTTKANWPHLWMKITINFDGQTFFFSIIKIISSSSWSKQKHKIKNKKIKEKTHNTHTHVVHHQRAKRKWSKLALLAGTFFFAKIDAVCMMMMTPYIYKQKIMITLFSPCKFSTFFVYRFSLKLFFTCFFFLSFL